MKFKIRITTGTATPQAIADSALQTEFIVNRSTVLNVEDFEITGGVITFEVEKLAGPFCSKLDAAEALIAELGGAEVGESVEAAEAAKQHAADVVEAEAKLTKAWGLEGLSAEDAEAKKKEILDGLLSKLNL